MRSGDVAIGSSQRDEVSSVLTGSRGVGDHQRRDAGGVLGRLGVEIGHVHVAISVAAHLGEQTDGAEWARAWLR